MKRLPTAGRKRAETRSFYEAFPYNFGSADHERTQLDATLLGPLVEALRARGGAVLDAGCGTGLLLQLVERHLPQMTCYGVDLTSAAIASCVQQGIRARVVQADLLALPFTHAAFDLVTCRGVLMITPDPPAAFAELVRVTRPGGHCFVRVYNRHHPYRVLYGLLSPLCRRLYARRGGEQTIRRWIYPLFRGYVKLALFVTRRKIPYIPEVEFWHFFADQYLTPHCRFYSRRDIRKWAAIMGLREVRSAAVTMGQQLDFWFVRPTAGGGE